MKIRYQIYGEYIQRLNTLGIKKKGSKNTEFS